MGADWVARERAAAGPCPVCDSEVVAPVVQGEGGPGERDDVDGAGCLQPPPSLRWRCRTCGHGWGPEGA